MIRNSNSKQFNYYKPIIINKYALIFINLSYLAIILNGHIISPLRLYNRMHPYRPKKYGHAQKAN